MKKNMLGITEGKAKVYPLKNSYHVNVGFIHVASLVCVDNPNADSNATLIADAFNTANECQLLPSELLRQRDELIMYTKSLMEYINSTRSPMTTEKQLIERLRNTINQIEQ